MTHPLHGFTHLDAIGILAQAHLELRQDSRSSLRELSEASQVLRKAEEFQFSLTQNHFDFTGCYES